MYFKNYRGIYNNLILLLIIVRFTKCTIDINLSEFQYLANHLHDEECRRLVAGLHFHTYDMPNPIDQAERKVSKEVPCLKQLLHWNSEKDRGKGESHEFVSRRLNQIGREDLATWLTRTSYLALQHDFERSVRDSFKPYEPIRLPTLNITFTTPQATLQPNITSLFSNASIRRVIKQDLPVSPTPDLPTDPTEWTIFDTISWTIVTMLFLIIITLVVYLTLASPCCSKKKRSTRRQNKYDFMDEDDYAMSSPICRTSPTCNPSAAQNYMTCPGVAAAAKAAAQQAQHQQAQHQQAQHQQGQHQQAQHQQHMLQQQPQGFPPPPPQPVNTPQSPPRIPIVYPQQLYCLSYDYPSDYPQNVVPANPTGMPM